MLKMPHWLNKATFSPKKTPARKVPSSLSSKDLSPKRIERELGPNIGEIKISLGDQQAIFENGIWVPESGKLSSIYKENDRLKKDIKKMEEENYLLKIKFELLLDMLVQVSSDVKLSKENIQTSSKFSHRKHVTT